MPIPSAPIMYGSKVAGSDLLPWEWAKTRLDTAQNYWISTTRPDGRPHCRPVWGVWLDDALWFSTGSLAQHNLTNNHAITAHLEDGDEVVIVEGNAESAHGHASLQQMCDVYGAKYDWPIYPTEAGIRDDNTALGPVFRVVPEVVFGWGERTAKPTRWLF
jgi:hypothetical protein